jgi:hypothetical protein
MQAFTSQLPVYKDLENLEPNDLSLRKLSKDVT